MNFEKKNNTYKIIMLVIVTALITFLLTTALLYNYYFKSGEGKVKVLTKYLEKSEGGELSAKLEIVKEYLNKYYVGDLNEKSMIESAIKGYIDGIGDKYTEYLTSSEYEDLMVSVNGKYIGIGIYMTKNIEGEVVVLLPIKGSPAEEADIRTGDVISKINGENCLEMELDLVANKIKGEEGTTIKLEIIRENEKIEKEITRRGVELEYVYSEILKDNIGYIQMISFDEHSTIKFKEYMQEFKEKGITSLIIDLRNNGGGIVSEAITMSELFLNYNSIIMKSYDKQGNEKIIKSSNITPSDMKLVILVNENSASATEIFTGALQDNNRAKVVGKTTFGKGIMQQLFELNSGGVLKITTEEFKTPKGNEINHVGIMPDIEIEESEDKTKDSQLEKAIEILKNN